MKRHIFRMVQELLNNAKKHSSASLVHIELAVHDGCIQLLYRDDGIGFEVRAAEEAEGRSSITGSGFGMEQLRSRALELNGSFELTTALGQGVKVNVQIPIKEVITT